MFVPLFLVLVAQATPLQSVAPKNHIWYSIDASPAHCQLFIAKGDGREEKPLLPLNGLDYSPSLSKDGRWVVFTSDRNGSADIYRVHPDGTGFERLTDDKAFDELAKITAPATEYRDRPKKHGGGCGCNAAPRAAMASTASRTPRRPSSS